MIIKFFLKGIVNILNYTFLLNNFRDVKTQSLTGIRKSPKSTRVFGGIVRYYHVRIQLDDPPNKSDHRLYQPTSMYKYNTHIIHGSSAVHIHVCASSPQVAYHDDAGSQGYSNLFGSRTLFIMSWQHAQTAQCRN